MESEFSAATFAFDDRVPLLTWSVVQPQPSKPQDIGSARFFLWSGFIVIRNFFFVTVAVRWTFSGIPDRQEIK